MTILFQNSAQDILNRKFKFISLVGLSGSGKTTVGDKLAKFENLDFIDSDSYIEFEQNMSVDEIFRKFGEEHFRFLEQQFINDIIAKTSNLTILSLGAGLPCFNDIIYLIKQNSLIVYLKTDIHELCKRLNNSSLALRPLLNSSESVESTLYTMLNKREKFYNMADLIVDSTKLTVDQIVSVVQQYYQAILSTQSRTTSIE